MTLQSIEELEQLRAAYHEQVVTHVTKRGQPFVDMAISAPGARFILERLEEHYQGDPSTRQYHVLDMGLGFSTCFVGQWVATGPYRRYFGVDPNEVWCAFMKDVARGMSLPVEVKPRAAFRPATKHFDAIIVDHGPQLQTRADDVPWLVTLLANDGIMLFDDWRPKHEGRIRRAFAAVAGDWHIEAPEHVRRSPRDKSIGFVRRSR